MDNEIRDCVLGIVAGFRGEKRAARAVAVRRLLSAFKRGKSLLTGSHLRRLEAHRGVLADIMDGVERNASRLQREYFNLHNSDPLHGVDLTVGKWVGAPNYRPNLSYLGLEGPALEEAELVSRALKPRINAAKKLYDTEMDRFWRTEGRLHRSGVNLDRGLEAQIENEQRAVNATRLIAGLGAAGALGGAGYGTYKAVSGKESGMLKHKQRDQGAGVDHGSRAQGREAGGHILSEAEAVRNARIAAGLLGTLGLGWAGYGTVSDRRRRAGKAGVLTHKKETT